MKNSRPLKSYHSSTPLMTTFPRALFYKHWNLFDEQKFRVIYLDKIKTADMTNILCCILIISFQTVFAKIQYYNWISDLSLEKRFLLWFFFLKFLRRKFHFIALIESQNCLMIRSKRGEIKNDRKISVSKICTDFAIYLHNSRTMEKH